MGEVELVSEAVSTRWAEVAAKGRGASASERRRGHVA